MDFYFENDQPLELGGVAQKLDGNLQAIRLAKELTAANRPATPEEQTILARYVGWGDAALLRKLTGSEELKDLLSDDEMRSARGSSLNAHYTALPVIGAMWTALDVMGFGAHPFRALDPSAGVGHFKSLTPVAMRDKAEWVEIELDSLTAQILGLLHPESKVFADGFERVNLPENWFDLVISQRPLRGLRRRQPARTGLPAQVDPRLLLRQHGTPTETRRHPGLHHLALYAGQERLVRPLLAGAPSRPAGRRAPAEYGLQGQRGHGSGDRCDRSCVSVIRRARKRPYG